MNEENEADAFETFLATCDTTIVNAPNSAQLLGQLREAQRVLAAYGSVIHEPSLLFDPEDPEEGETQCVPVGAAVVFGRNEKADIATRGRKMSSRHFQVTTAEDGFAVKDLESRNGTKLNGDPLEGTQPLRSGDVIKAGGISFTFIIPLVPN